jgi:hypothetical protein
VHMELRAVSAAAAGSGYSYTRVRDRIPHEKT